MPDLADLYPGDASRWIDTSAGKLFARVGGSGPPLLLLHGHPQSNVMWHRVAPLLAPHFTLVIADLPGYGWSAAPEARDDHAPYTKRAMAAGMVEMMEALGFVHFRLAGHDRGGRVGYRLALDHAGRLEQLAVLDIVSTCDMWHHFNATLATRAWHWTFLALPHRFPRRSSVTTRRFSSIRALAPCQKGKTAFDLRSARARALSRILTRDPTRIRAMCEDYRASRTHRSRSRRSRSPRPGKRLAARPLALWGTGELPANGGLDPLTLWRD